MALKERSVPNLRERKRASTENRLRSTAVRLFLERGFANVTVDEIAAAAEVSRSTFFRYFGSKEAVLFDRVDDAGEVFTRALDRRPGTESPLEALEVALLELLAHTSSTQTEDEQLAVSELMRTDPALSGRRLREIERWMERLSGTFATRAGRDEPAMRDRLAAAACVAIGEEVGAAWRTDPTRDPAELVHEAVDSVRSL
jgi:AcrR family transcriptional regulator